VEAGGNNSAIKLSAGGIVLEGFTVTNAGAAWDAIGRIDLTSSGNAIRNNTACRNDHSILLFESGDNTATGNTVTGNAENGIYLLSDCNGNTISDNTINSSYDTGIRK
jgi:parallel beta-helix repeat protein